MAAPEPAPRRGREREREEESEDESDILEESPCGRWQKRREQVSQGNMPGVQSAFLAMDTEEGVEVVWNELHFGNRKAFAAHEEKIQTVFAQLALVDHPNIVKLHKYWLDTSEARARMAVLEIQANGDARVTEEAIARARHSLGDPNMREFILSCLARDPACRPSAHSLLLHRVLFEVHSLKLLAAHCCIQYQHLMPENVVEEKAKAVDLHAVLAEIPRLCRPPLQWRYSEVPFLELGKFLEDVRTGLYPLMSFAAARPLGLPRALAPPPEEAQMAKTPTPELFDLETRRPESMLTVTDARPPAAHGNGRGFSCLPTPAPRPAPAGATPGSVPGVLPVTQMQCSLERSEDKARWHLTLLLVLEDRMHRQLTYDLLPTDSAQELATELVHYGFLHEDDRLKLAAFLESTFLKHRGAQA
ncbi:Nuclear receptor-binding protein 2 [Tupaia chinensis]|uniref:Nuclear receptor-binding protein 2 n=1 Tax=Tupaia chinensis TaxID=246437 RepID=L9KLN0_TUPCH|nr:Nuclear receptor-binding protein 2 [Tupaia chinensis]